MTAGTANIGGLPATGGYRVLFVDLDPQGSLAENLGHTGYQRDDGGQNLASAPAERPNLDVFVGGPNLD